MQKKRIYNIARKIKQKRIMVISYPGLSVPRLVVSYPRVWSFRIQDLVVSYPRVGGFVPKDFSSFWITDVTLKDPYVLVQKNCY